MNNKIKKLRKKAGLSQVDLAKILGISHVSIVKWEKGTTMPRTKMLPRLAKVLRCEVNDFF
jgi:DNA-binding XRE family transcriptional regulator